MFFSLFFSNKCFETSKETQVTLQFGKEGRSRNLQFQPVVAGGIPGATLGLQAEEA